MTRKCGLCGAITDDFHFHTLGPRRVARPLILKGAKMKTYHEHRVEVFWRLLTVAIVLAALIAWIVAAIKAG